MIDHARLVTLRDRFTALRGTYAHSGDELRAATSQLARERAGLVAIVAAGLFRNRVRLNPHLTPITAEKVARDPDVMKLAESMTDAELVNAGAKPAQIASIKAHAAVLIRKRTAHDALAARVRVWAQYMASVEAFAAEHGA